MMIAAVSIDDDVDDSQDVVVPVQVLLRLASTARLYRSGDGGLHARVPIGDRYEVYGLRSAGFRDWLIDGYFADRHEPPCPSAILRVVSVLEARARFDGGTPALFIRVARGNSESASAYFLDLGDSTGAAVKVCAQGWQVVDRPDVQFQRPEGLLPLPVPARDGSIDLLRPYVNLTDDGFRLMIAWLTAALRPVGPYPILSLHGEQGSAKSTLARILRLLIDPQSCPLLAEPASTRDLMVTAINGWLLAYDNITAIPAWLSDSLCRLVFGGGISGRKLFSNADRSVVHAQRPVILNGIEDYVRKSDLVDRTVFLQLPSIGQNRRRAEEEFWRSFRAEHSRILGGVLDAVVGGLRERPSVKLARLPRMADFAQWGEAVGRGLGWEPEAFVSAYENNRFLATEMALDGSPLGNAVIQFARSMLEWNGSPTEVYEMLTQSVGKRIARSPAWPKTTQRFTNELRRLAPQLRMHGVFVIFGRTRDSRSINLVTAEYLALVEEAGDAAARSGSST
jgi:hypothetical protein